MDQITQEDGNANNWVDRTDKEVDKMNISVTNAPNNDGEKQHEVAEDENDEAAIESHNENQEPRDNPEKIRQMSQEEINQLYVEQASNFHNRLSYTLGPGNEDYNEALVKIVGTICSSFQESAQHVILNEMVGLIKIAHQMHESNSKTAIFTELNAIRSILKTTESNTQQLLTAFAGVMTINEKTKEDFDKKPMRYEPSETSRFNKSKLFQKKQGDDAVKKLIESRPPGAVVNKITETTSPEGEKTVTISVLHPGMIDNKTLSRKKKPLYSRPKETKSQ